MQIPNRQTSENVSSFAQNMRRMQALQRQNDPNQLATFSMTELFEKQLSSRPPVIDNLLPCGAYLLVGPPKIGKSFLVAQIAYSVSMGISILGRSAQQGGVLYLALEDNERRLQERLARMFGVEGNDNLHLATNAGSIYDNLNMQLDNYMRQHPDTLLIIVDTLQKIRDTINDYSYGKDYDVIGQLKEFADSHGVCVLIVHHTRKQWSDDAFEMISGTTGLLGSADGAIMMAKAQRTDRAATLDITSRDMPDQRLHLLRNEKTLVWELDHEDTVLWKAPPDPLLEKIAKLIAGRPSWSGSATELLELLGESMQPNILTRMLNVKGSSLKTEYGIAYTSRHTRNGSIILLSKLVSEA